MRKLRINRSLFSLIYILASIMTPVHTGEAMVGQTYSYVSAHVKQVDPFLPLMSRLGDLDAIRQYGYLRVLVNETQSSEFESRLLKEYTDLQGIGILFIQVDGKEQGLRALLTGQGDVLIGENFGHAGIVRTLPFNTQNRRAVKWALRSSNPMLKAALNHQINRYLISMGLPTRYQEDLSGLKKRRLLRVVTRPDPNNYFLENGRPVGFEYELLKRFAKQHKLWLDVIVAADEQEMIYWLKEGKADLMTMKVPDNDDAEIVNSLPFYPASHLIITGKAQTEIKQLADINGKLLAVFDHKDPDQAMDKLAQKGTDIAVLVPEPGVSKEDFLQRVAKREYPAGMISDQDFISADEFQSDLKVISSVGGELLGSWAVNSRHAELLKAINAFIRKEYKSEYYNMAYQRYFPESGKQANGILDISPFDKLVRKYAGRYEFDWRLIIAQIYQESRFRPDANSVSGAKGLMQIMPRTAREIGVEKVEDPEKGIEAGLRYMQKLRDRYGQNLPASERNWFTLAAYNAGFERIEDARNFAKKLGLNPDRWFGHVEQAMRQLADPENSKHTRFGPCQCGQTVVYVRHIKKFYNSYVQLTDPLLLASVSSFEAASDNVLDQVRWRF